MKQSSTCSCGILLVFFSILFGGCGTGNNERSINKSIEIGVVLPLTGELASYGEPMREGIEFALEELNENSGDSLSYELSFIDSKAEQAAAISGLQKLINIEGVKFVIGDVSSSTTLAMVPVAEENRVFLLSPGASSPKLHDISPYFARNYPSSTEESIESAKFIYNTLGEDSVGIVHVNNEYGLGLSTVFQEAFRELGGKVTFTEAYQFEQSDFRTLITKLRSLKPNVLYLAGNQREMGKFMNQYGGTGLNSKIVSNISFLEPDCLETAGDAANGVIVPVPYYNPQDSTTVSAYNFGKKYFNEFNKYPTVAVAVGYDALKLMVEGILQKGSEPAEVAGFIRNYKNYKGALGNISFTEGDVSVPVVFKVVEDGVPINYQKEKAVEIVE